jgi:putative hemin transport protein
MSKQHSVATPSASQDRTQQWADPAALRHAAQALRDAERLRARDLALRLQVGEGELLAARVGIVEHRATDEAASTAVVRLQSDFPAIIETVPTLGKVMALTRNDAIVHERQGVYGGLSHRDGMGLALGPDIDLRIFYRQWKAAYAVSEPGPHGVLHSLQFFDAQAEAVHKIYLKDETKRAAFDALVAQWRAPEQLAHGAGPDLPPRAAVPTERPDGEIDVAGFHAAWRGMQDTHEFFGILKRFDLGRLQALRLAEPAMARRVPIETLQALLENASREAVPIMVFVGNPGLIQIHTGPVKTIRVMGSWLNVLDPDFNLHINVDLLSDAFVVRKPTADGVVTSLEVFDGEKRNVGMFFGARKPGQPELPAWRALLDSVYGADSTSTEILEQA